MFVGVTVAGTLLSGWQWAPLPAIGLVTVGGGYLAAVRRVNHADRSHPWARSHTTCFLAGTAATVVAIMGPPGYYDDTFFYAHMTQHILLTMVAAPLLVLGNPVLLSLRVSPRELRRRWLMAVYRSRAVEYLTRPAVGWLVFVTVVVVSHLPTLYDDALVHPLVHDYVEHPLYIGCALMYFYPLLASTPGRHRVPHGVRALSLFTMMIPMSITGFFIYAVPHVAYPFYAHTPRPFGPAPLADQELSGALMWSTSMIAVALLLCVAGLRWLHDEESRSRRVDRAVARSLASTPEHPGPECPT